MYTIAAIFTAKGGLGDLLSGVLRSEMEDVNMIEITDSGLLFKIIEDKGLKKQTLRRILKLYESAVESGADMILNTCSTIGEAADMAGRIFDVPVVKIDDAMLREAAAHYKKIGVLATLTTTLKPTDGYLKRIAAEQNKTVEITEAIAENAFEAAISGNGALHNDLVVQKAKSFKDVEAIVLAQASMMNVQERIAMETGLPVLSSPRLCAAQIAAMRALKKI